MDGHSPMLIRPPKYCTKYHNLSDTETSRVNVLLEQQRESYYYPRENAKIMMLAALDGSILF
jgi:hypothetical protein